MTANDTFSSYRGYFFVKHPSGIVGIFPMPSTISDFDNAPNIPLSTAHSLDEAQAIIDAWMDAP